LEGRGIGAVNTLFIPNIIPGGRQVKVNLHRTINVVWIDVDYTLDVLITSIGNNGIGPYEYWGAKCYDHGIDYAEDWEIRRIMDADGQPVPDEEAAPIIDKMYDDVSLVEEIQAKLDEYVHDSKEER
jgi:hypothetical protein